MRCLEIKRHMDADAIATVTELLAAAERADGHPALADHQWLDLVSGGRAGFAGLVAWEPGHSHPVAYAQVSRGNNSWGLELVVDPHHRYDMATIGPELLGAAADVVRAEGGGRLHWWVFEATTIHHELAEQIGLQPTRLLHQMRRPVPTGMPVTVETRAFKVGQDETSWLAVNNRAFAGHPEQGGWDLPTLLARENETWFNPQGFRLHEVDGQLAAFCWTKIHADRTPALGEIYVIAVDPAFHSRGLGRQLTLAGLDWLARAGITIGMLHVDADNVGAVSLYESLGFSTHHDNQAFVGDIR